MKILLIGTQGSGKSTQAKLLAEYLNIPSVETGQIFRDLANDDSGLGKSVKARIDVGEMIDDETTAELVKKRVNESDCEGGFVMNGYPRSLKQIKLFDPGFDRVIYLKVSDAEVTERLLKRSRVDDSKDAIQKRLAHYHEQTEPMMDHYRDLGKVFEIEGVGSIEEIQSKLRGKLDGQD